MSRWTVECRRASSGWVAEIQATAGRPGTVVRSERAATLHALRPQVVRQLRSLGAGAEFAERYHVPGEPLLQNAIDLADASAPTATRSGRFDRAASRAALQLIERGFGPHDVAGALNVTPELVLTRFWGALHRPTRQR